MLILIINLIDLNMKKITKSELKELYLNNENKVVCKKLGITNATLISYLKKAGIALKGKGNKSAGKPKLIIE